MNQKIFVNITLIVLIVVLASAAGYYIYFNKQESPKIDQEKEIIVSQKDKNLFFYATRNSNDRSITVTVLDVKNNKIISSAKIEGLEDSTGSASVQYNPLTRDIFIVTDTGESPIGCTHPDGRCSSKIYRLSLNNLSEKPQVIFEKEANISMLVNPYQNTIIVTSASLEHGELSTWEIDIETKKVTAVNNYPKNLRPSSNERYAQADMYQDTSLKGFHWLDMQTKEVKDIPFATFSIEQELSPDGNLVAYYGEASLFTYNVRTQQHELIYNGSIPNVTLSWSPDSKKLVYILDNKLSYYDIDLKKSFVFEESTNPVSYYVFGWSFSNRYIVFTLNNSKIYFYDIIEKRRIDPKQVLDAVSSDEMLGMYWF